MQRFLLILSVILWFYGHPEPVVFPDGDGLMFETAMKMTYEGKVQLVKIVTVYDGGTVLYQCDLADVLAMKLIHNVL